MGKFIFHDWQVYKDARTLRKELFKLTKKFSPEEKFCLTTQTNRAALSVMLQIAEGANRKTDKDKALFFNRSYTSVNEIVGYLDAAIDSGYINAEEYAHFIELCENIAKQFKGFTKYLNKSA